MTSALQRLLKYPHAAVFNKDPISVVAFHLSHEDGAAWLVSDGVLRATGGAVDILYTLSEFTVGSLASALEDDGFDVDFLSADVSSLSALVLVEGAGDWGRSNGDRLFAFTSLLWVLLSSYAGEVTAAGLQVREALRQMVMHQASGEWLELWGSLYNVPRKAGEGDAAFTLRIKAEAFRVRVNARGIEQAILDDTGFDVRIEEPWREIFILDESMLSGPHKLYDGVNVGYHLIRPEARSVVDWPSVRAVIERNRAAGVLVLQSRSVHGYHVDGSDSGAVDIGHDRLFGAAIPYESRSLLDFMRIEDVSIPNRAARHIRGTGNISHVIVDPASYSVVSTWYRTYRYYRISVSYSSHSWVEPLLWKIGDSNWGTSTIVSSAHTRS